jgi:hypothetical protein
VTKDVGFGVVGLTYSAPMPKDSCAAATRCDGANASAYCWGTNRCRHDGVKDVARARWS